MTRYEAKSLVSFEVKTSKGMRRVRFTAGVGGNRSHLETNDKTLIKAIDKCGLLGKLFVCVHRDEEPHERVRVVKSADKTETAEVAKQEQESCVYYHSDISNMPDARKYLIGLGVDKGYLRTKNDIIEQGKLLNIEFDF